MLLLPVHKFSKLLLCSISALPETGLKDPSTCQDISVGNVTVSRVLSTQKLQIDQDCIRSECTLYLIYACVTFMLH